MPARPLGCGGRRRRRRGGAARAARAGPSRPSSSAATSSARSLCGCASVGRSFPPSSWPRRASRRRSRSPRPMLRSRWGCSSPARAGASTAARRRRACRTAPCSACAVRSASPALLMSFNTPLPNVAWKAFPSLLCGNASVVKPSEETPASAYLFARVAHECGVPPGVLNVVQGSGPEAGAALVEHPAVDLVSLHRLGGDRALDQRDGWVAGSRRSASSSAARTRSSSATTPTSTWRCAGRSPRPSRTPGSGARRRAGSSSSIRSTTPSARNSLDAAPARSSLSP